MPQLTLSKTGQGSVFIGTVSDTTNIAMTGTGAVSANQTDNLSLIQQGSSPRLASLYTASGWALPSILCLKFGTLAQVRTARVSKHILMCVSTPFHGS